MLRRIVSIWILVVLCFLILTGCADDGPEAAPAPEQTKTAAEYQAEAEKEITEDNAAAELDKLEQEALNAPDGKAFVRQGAKIMADVGGKHVGVIDAPADVCWLEVKKLMADQERLQKIYDNITFLKDVEVMNSGLESFSIKYNAKLVLMPASLDLGFVVDEQNRIITGCKTGGTFGTFVAKGAEHDIGVIPLDDNKSLLVVRFIGKVIFPASLGSAVTLSAVGMNKSFCPKMTSAFIDEVRAGVMNSQRTAAK